MKSDYASTEDYIRGEYDGEIPIVEAILNRHGVDDLLLSAAVYDAVVMDIVGYYTGCLTPDGNARVSRRSA